MLPTIKLTGSELIEHDEGFVTMRLHCELPNGAHYFVDEDNYHVGLGSDAPDFAHKLNGQLTKANADTVVALIVGEETGKIVSNVHGAYLFTLVDRVEFRPEDLMSDDERYAHEQCMDATEEYDLEDLG